MGAIEAKASDLDPSVVHPVDFAYNSVASQLLPTIVREYLSSRAEAEMLMNKLSSMKMPSLLYQGLRNRYDFQKTIRLIFEEAISAALVVRKSSLY